MTKTTLRIPEHLYERVERLAALDHRSVNGELVALIEAALVSRELPNTER